MNPFQGILVSFPHTHTHTHTQVAGHLFCGIMNMLLTRIWTSLGDWKRQRQFNLNENSTNQQFLEDNILPMSAENWVGKRKVESKGSFISHKGMSLVSILVALGHKKTVLHSQMTFQIYCSLVLKSMWKVHGRYRKGSQWNAPCFNPQEQCVLNTKAYGVRRMNKTIMTSLYIDYKKYWSGKFKKLIY